MSTWFDIITITSFLGLVAAFFFYTERDTKTLLHFMVSALTLAVANQVGNAGNGIFAILLIAASFAYAFLMVWKPA